MLWLACCLGAVAYRKLAIPTGAVCFAPLASHRNCVLPKPTHLLNEFPSAPAWCALLPGMLLFNWPALVFFFFSSEQPSVSLESRKVVRLLSGGQEGEQCRCECVWVRLKILWKEKDMGLFRRIKQFKKRIKLFLNACVYSFCWYVCVLDWSLDGPPSRPPPPSLLCLWTLSEN